jgi:2-amino-4-hydroxy-6-hydroxymethyldihydropteridine diphosphokinase
MDTLKVALNELTRRGVEVRQLSPWYRSAPVPASEQPWFDNAVAEVADGLLAVLHEVEELFGRARTTPNAARLIDLDLLDFRGEIAPEGPGKATLPHPRLGVRAFVLRPLADLAPDWRHPVSGISIGELSRALPREQLVEKL